MSTANYVRQNTLGIRLNFRGLTRLQKSAMALAAITGTVHLYLFATQSFIPFLLAGLGFYTAAVLMGTTFDRRVLYLGGIPYTVAQIAMWVQMGMPDFEIGVFDKTVQVVLICLLAYLFVGEWNAHKTAAEQLEEAEHGEEVAR